MERRVRDQGARALRPEWRHSSAPPPLFITLHSEFGCTRPYKCIVAICVAQPIARALTPPFSAVIKAGRDVERDLKVLVSSARNMETPKS